MSNKKYLRRHYKEWLEEVIPILKANFPKVFGQESIPLAIGIHKQIKEQLPKLSGMKIKTALVYWTRQLYYHEAFLNPENFYRSNLDGSPAQFITVEDRQRALAEATRIKAIKYKPKIK